MLLVIYMSRTCLESNELEIEVFSLPTFPIYDKILLTKKEVRQAERAFTLA